MKFKFEIIYGYRPFHWILYKDDNLYKFPYIKPEKWFFFQANLSRSGISALRA